MHICVDVYYTDQSAIASGVLFQNWDDPVPTAEVITATESAQPYEPGKFYKRELAPILHLIDQVTHDLDTIVIDGFVWLDDTQTPGLGAYLFDAMKKQVSIIGVAKNRFRHSSGAAEVFRGKSERPLFVTSVGVDLQTSASLVRSMHGEFRVPTLLKHADRLGRNEVKGRDHET